MCLYTGVVRPQSIDVGMPCFRYLPSLYFLSWSKAGTFYIFEFVHHGVITPVGAITKKFTLPSDFPIFLHWLLLFLRPRESEAFISVLVSTELKSENLRVFREAFSGRVLYLNLLGVRG